jgi:MFS family permease
MLQPSFKDDSIDERQIALIYKGGSVMGKAWQEFHPVVKIILIGSMLTSIGHGMIVPYFAIYLGEYTHLSISEIGFIIGASSLAGMAGGFLGGTLSDVIGRRKVMIVSLCISSFIILGLTIHSFPWLLILFTVVKGFTLSFFDPSAKALIGDLTDSEKRLSAFSMKYFCGNLGFAIGPIIGTIFGFTEISTVPFYIAFAIFVFYSALLNLFFIKFKVTAAAVQDEKLRIRDSVRIMGKDKVLFLFLIGGMLATTVHGQFSVTLSQFFYSDFKEGLRFLGVLWSAHSMTIIVLSAPITKFMKKRTPFDSIIVGTSLFTLGIIGFWLSHSFPAFLVAMIVFTIGEIFLIPAEYAIIDQITPVQIRGTYFGAVSFTALGSFVGPGLTGLLLAEFNSTIMFLFLTVISVVSLLFYYWGIRMKTEQDRVSIDSITVE